MRLARCGTRFRSHDVLDAGQREQVAIRGGIDEKTRLDERLAIGLETSDEHPCYSVSLHPGCNRAVRMQDEELARELIRHHHLMDHGDRDSRIMAEPAHPAIARIQPPAIARRGRKRCKAAVILTDSLPQFSIACCGTELFD